jgi:FkbM family methyltransferase
MKRSRRKALINDIRVAILLIPLIIFSGILLPAKWPPAGALLLFARGRAGICSLSEALRSPKTSMAQVSLTEEMKARRRLVQKDAAGFSLWDTPRGKFWLPSNSREAVEYDLAEQARQIYGDQKLGVHAGDVVLDCGANVGVFTRTALERGARLVVAIEPAPENLECLRRNFAHEIGGGRVIVYPKGVWNRDDLLTLRVDPQNSAADTFVRLDRGVPSIQVPLTTIDKLAGELNLPHVDFIKMDIEGAEQQAVAGAAATIARYKPRLALCVYHLSDDPVMVPKLVRQINPAYRSTCGCLMYQTEIQAQVVFFH